MDSEDSDQTGQMPKLIRIFAGGTSHFVCFVMQQLIYIVELGSLVLTGISVFSCSELGIFTVVTPTSPLVHV